MNDESYLSLFAVDGFAATAATGNKPPPWIPQGPKSLSAAAAEPFVPSIGVTMQRKDDKVVRAVLQFHHLSDTRANALADALEKAAKDLRRYRGDAFNPDDPGVELDVTAALVRGR